MSKKNVLGIDIGSISIAIAEIDTNGALVKGDYRFHNGSIHENLKESLKKFDITKLSAIAVTSSTPDIVDHTQRFDSRICYINAAKKLNKQMGALLIVGGERFGLAQFDKDGEYLSYRSNSSCAAGTGSFLDQQAKRLNLSGIEEFSEIAYNSTGNVPRIASRCAVFAKTDLIHAQQEGFSLEEICDGLSHGLAKNIADTLFTNTEIISPMIFAGGVSRNQAVVGYIAEMSGAEVIVDDHSHLYGAIGAAVSLQDEKSTAVLPENISFNELLKVPQQEKHYHYSELELKYSDYPDFSSLKKYEYTSQLYPKATPVEVDIYENFDTETDAYLGIDIGSTSTKAVLVNRERKVLAGFYTRTSGRPVEAVQTIFESIDSLMNDRQIRLNIIGTGTTGSGRKFIARIIGADLALDEITAHARAACELDPQVDTIIEIGGQDSKFTTLRNGMVTFSVMNNVCAAGTGSFIEEQAKKLGCPLTEYSSRAEGEKAPLSSDRCTVFMERDLNYYLSRGYSVEEILASVLHAVRENYLMKVSGEKSIGDRIFFQGATAKNRALVAAFEQRLNKKIMVSQFCHLTGALGTALYLADEKMEDTGFRGIDIYKNSIPVRTEVCELCTNHCKIRLADVGGETVAFGFLCGRDYATKKFVKEGTGFDLLKERKRIFSQEKRKKYKYETVIGIPAALHLVDELPLWRRFFHNLSIKTINSEAYNEAVKEGKNLTGAEFCAPLTALHGHVKHLLEKADYVFLPDYMENKQEDKKLSRNYCYYTQYSSVIISSLRAFKGDGRILRPLVRSINNKFYMKGQLYTMLKKIGIRGVNFWQVSQAYDEAEAYTESCSRQLKALFQHETANTDDISVVLLGRPYTVLSRSMNNRIPEIFSRQGIKTFFQDMVEPDGKVSIELDNVLKTIHWKYGATILETADSIARQKGLYPVFVTSFKCTPDAYVVEYFKQVLDAQGKPYLVLQLDEHDSTVGYETRIEAGIRSFRNHYNSNNQLPAAVYKNSADVILKGRPSLKDKTVLLPNWDHIACRLIEACFRHEGIDARLVSESDDSIHRSMTLNSGQCIPITIIAQNFIDYIEKHNLDPAQTVLWTPESNIACNLGMFPLYTQKLMESYGRGMEKVSVYKGAITFVDISIRAAVNIYFGYMFGGYLNKMACRVRPYEVNKGETDRAVEKSMDILYDLFLHDTSKDRALEEIINIFEKIEIVPGKRPKVAIFGDLYVRDNEVLNQGLIRIIEDNGGEVVTTPYSELVQYVAEPYLKKWLKQGHYGEVALNKVLKRTALILEKQYYKYFYRILKEDLARNLVDPMEVMSRLNLSLYHTGESMENILKIFNLVKKYPDISLFVQTNPSYCCPSLVTEAMADKIEEITGVPIVTVEYDGTGGSKNDDVIPFLKYPRRSAEQVKKAKIG